MSYGYTLFEKVRRTAKKAHRCIWCGETILPGVRYSDERSIYDGNIQRHRWHLECERAADIHFRVEGEEEFDPYENDRPHPLPKPEQP